MELFIFSPSFDMLTLDGESDNDLSYLGTIKTRSRLSYALRSADVKPGIMWPS